jgi:DNA topoisomerase-1
VAKNLVIVESPAKAKTIEKYLGKDFKVVASLGHVRDLPKSEFGIEVDGGVNIKYVASRSANARKAMSGIRKAAGQAETIWLATDPDREGEAIAWHVAKLAKFKHGQVRRVAFNEITQRAVAEAFESPRDVDMHLVDAQQARRAIDRILGYRLSPLLWRNVGPNLSAGRVQSPTLWLVVQREKEIRDFKPREYWDIKATLTPEEASSSDDDQEGRFTAFHPVGSKNQFALETEAATTNVVDQARPGPWKVTDVRKSERKKKPPAPFKTSTLQQLGSSKLGFPTWKTMQVAQGLYEAGRITYMRTDSSNLSSDSLGQIGSYVRSTYGERYHQRRTFSAKVKGAQEAHESIRPTDVNIVPADLQGALDKDAYKLYELIWQRTVACQMAEAVYDATTIDIDANGVPFRATGQVLKFDGFLRVYLEVTDDEKEEIEGFLPQLEAGQVLTLLDLEPQQHFTQPPPRYTEATLVRKMEEVGIGRPSTYAPTVRVLNDREYVRSESRRLFLVPRGEVVTDLMDAHFPDIVDVDFTARMEEDLDDIAEGGKRMVPVVKSFYESFTSRVEEQQDKMSRPERPTDKTCPECGRPVVEKFGKHGLWFLSCSGWPDCKWSQQLDEEGNPLPDPEGTGEKCPQCGSELVAKTGRFGPFVGCSNYPDCKYIKKEPPKEIGESCPECGSPLVEKRGRFGPFVGCSNYPDCKYIKKDKPSGSRSKRSKSTAKKKSGKKKTSAKKKSSSKRGAKTT